MRKYRFKAPTIQKFGHYNKALGLVAALIPLALSSPLYASDEVIGQSVSVVRDYRQANERTILEDYIKLLSMPNDAAIAGEVETNAAYLMDQLEARGFSTQLLKAGKGAPSVFAARDYKGANKTLTFYIHYDGQSVDKSNWANDPFEPTMRDGSLLEGAKVVDWRADQGAIPENWRLYARSASDDKAPIISMFTVLDAFEKANITPSVNIRFFLEGEEEKGSPTLRALMEENKDLLKSDFWVFLDGPQDQRGSPRTVMGVRGSMGGEITVYGPNSGLHSGHYGNFAPNPITMMAHLLSSMRDENGHVKVKGFYDGVQSIDADTQKLIDAIPDADDAIQKAIGAGRVESKGMRYEATHLIPALNFQGITSGNTGAKARNIIEPKATTAIGVRLVPGQTPEGVSSAIDAHIVSQGYHLVRTDPDLETRMTHEKVAKVVWRSGYKSVRTSENNPYAQRLNEIMADVTEGKNLIYPIMGGSLPLAHITDVLSVPLVILPIANQDNSQHAANENIVIGNLWRGMEYYAAILAGFDITN